MITHIVSDWLFSPCCVEHQDEFIFERVAVAYSRDYNEVGRAQIKYAVNEGGIINQRTNGPVNAHLISWPSKAHNIQNLENIW